MSNSKSKKEEVFVIKSLNYSESDKIITVFGRARGKFSLFAKGVRKLNSKNRGNIQTFSISKISYYESTGMPLLLESEQVAVADYFEFDSKQAFRVLYVLNKILPEDSPNTNIFEALKSLIKKRVTYEYVNRFLLHFLLQEGLVGDLTECSKCGLKKDVLYFEKYQFGVVCSECLKEDGRESNLKTDESLYSNPEFTQSIDRYIKKIISENA